MPFQNPQNALRNSCRENVGNRGQDLIHKIKSCCRRRPECIGIRTNCGKYLYSPHILCYCFLASGADSETAYMIPQLSFGSARRGCVKGCPFGYTQLCRKPYPPFSQRPFPYFILSTRSLIVLLKFSTCLQ